MIKGAAAFLLVLAATGAGAQTVEAMVSPTTLIVRDSGGARIVSLPGKPVLYCGLDPFVGWSARLIGATLRMEPDQAPAVESHGRTMPLTALLARDGWLRPETLDEGAQVALVERRGGWACAPKAEAFAQMSARVDPRILASIAMSESAYRGRPWPWTLNVAGRGMYFATREDAHAAINQLVSEKRCNFDVGIMQINWCYHGQRFASSWDALAPATNIRVAEAILSENLQRSGSAMKAVAWYHSADPSRGGPYLARFMNHFKQMDSRAQ
ncbi:transglycosylase SLT domain-containing protein [Cupriavidus sp. D39]|uniref:transglycosylase SLT domain-containing protein n=1 Tax=Cupriavidus sp. D39 TaxID=2997877 RepID=UPI003B638C21